MGKFFEKVFEFGATQHEAVRRRPYGMIQASAGELDFVLLRPLPKLISIAEVAWFGGWNHRRLRRDRVQLYYNQPLGHRNYLSSNYIVSSLGTSLATVLTALRALDEIARIKGSDAILCDITNRRISDRIMQYVGFERHLLKSRRRHFIRRFYGVYPAHPQFSPLPAHAQVAARDSSRAPSTADAVGCGPPAH